MNEGREDYILKMKENSVYGSWIKSDFSSTDKSLTKFNVEAYRFGFINSEGVGYNLGVIAIIPYSSGGFGVTSFRKIEFAGVNPGYIYPDNDLIDRYGSDLRFNSINEGGVKLEIASTISLSAGYEYSVIYPRLMFWYWAGSEIIESAAEGCLNSFIHRIERSSPAAVPIVDMVLKNALSYGFYLLRKDKMNWPFETETPFTFETFKLGVTFTF